MKLPKFFLRIGEIKNLFKGNPLKLVGFIGLILVIVLAWFLLFYSLTRDKLVFPLSAGDNFYRDLGRYDTALLAETPEQLERRLDRLERQARRQDDWLSVLKRRRALAYNNPQFMSGYQKSALEAVRTFPYSEVIAAVAGESLLYGTPGRENSETLRNYADRINQQRFYPLTAALYVMAGSLGDPVLAVNIPNPERLFSPELSGQLRELLVIDNILLAVHNGNRNDITVRINELLREHPNNINILRLGAEFFYDFGNPFRAGELFSGMGDTYIGRTADALALAGNIPAARNIWSILASPQNESSQAQIRSFYNLAATAANSNEAISWLERIFGAAGNTGGVASNLYAIISYSRLLGTPRSIAMLDEGNLTDHPLIDLELLRRRLDIWPLDLSVAEVWMLLGRHPDSEELFQWGAWFFTRQKLESESAQLLKIAGQRQMSASWINLCIALNLIQEDRIDEGYKILEDEYKKNPADWRIYANMARVLESKRAIAGALAWYEEAAALVDNPKDASLLQLRLSRCLDALGRFEESQRALVYALELDPENLLARMESWRLERQGR